MLVIRLNVRPLREKVFDRIESAVMRGRDQRSPAMLVLRLNVRPLREQGFDRMESVVIRC